MHAEQPECSYVCVGLVLECRVFLSKDEVICSFRQLSLSHKWTGVCSCCMSGWVIKLRTSWKHHNKPAGTLWGIVWRLEAVQWIRLQGVLGLVLTTCIAYMFLLRSSFIAFCKLWHWWKVLPYISLIVSILQRGNCIFYWTVLILMIVVEVSPSMELV